MAQRLTPTLEHAPTIQWIKAVLTATGETIGVAGWVTPGHAGGPHNHFRRSAVAHYGWQARMGWTDAQVEEMWAHVDGEAWDGRFAQDDEARRALLGDEPHWYLAPLITWPAYHGRGVGRRLLDWAMEQADRTTPATPLYLESSPMARAVYAHCGFVPHGEAGFLRRGPGGKEGEEEKKKEEKGR